VSIVATLLGITWISMRKGPTTWEHRVEQFGAASVR